MTGAFEGGLWLANLGRAARAHLIRGGHKPAAADKMLDEEVLSVHELSLICRPNLALDELLPPQEENIGLPPGYKEPPEIGTGARKGEPPPAQAQRPPVTPPGGDARPSIVDGLCTQARGWLGDKAKKKEP